MNSRQRLLSTLSNEKVDRVPVAIYIDYLYAEFLKNTFDVDAVKDCFEYQKQLSFDVFLRQIPISMEFAENDAVWQQHTIDEIVNGGHNAVTVVHTPRGELRRIRRYYDRLPGELPPNANIEYFIKDAHDFDIYSSYYPKEEIKSLDNIKCARELVGDSGIISTDIGGVFNSAVELRGVQNLILDALSDEGFYRYQMEFQTDRIKQFISGICAEPVDLVRHYDNEANGAIISAAFYEKYVLPYEREVILYAEQHGLKVMLHNCGVMGQLLECYPDTGATAIESFSPPPNGDTDYEHVCRVLQDKMVRIGGIDQIHLLKKKDKQFISDEIRRAVTIMKGNSGYIACTSDQLDRDVPVENVLLYKEVAMSAGKY